MTEAERIQLVEMSAKSSQLYREIAFTEPAERQSAQTFRKRNAGVFDLSVNKSVGIMILLQMCDKRQHDERRDKPDQEPGIREGVAARQRVHILLHQKIQDAHSRHHQEIDDYGPDGADSRVS